MQFYFTTNTTVTVKKGQTNILYTIDRQLAKFVFRTLICQRIGIRFTKVWHM